jgi:hypothetical protein
MEISASLASNIIALGSLLVSGIVAYRQFRDRDHAAISLQMTYLGELMKWYAETILVLKELCAPPDFEDGERRARQLARLSALIERGRFYFPNVDKKDGFGLQKPQAYQGYRLVPLDYLVYSYNLHSKMDFQTHLAQAEKLMRGFTSEVYKVARPRDLLSQIRRLTFNVAHVDRTIEDLPLEEFLEMMDKHS